MNRLLLVFALLFGCGGYVTQTELDSSLEAYWTKEDAGSTLRDLVKWNTLCHEYTAVYETVRDICSYGVDERYPSLSVEDACKIKSVWYRNCVHVDFDEEDSDDE